MPHDDDQIHDDDQSLGDEATLQGGEAMPADERSLGDR